MREGVFAYLCEGEGVRDALLFGALMVSPEFGEFLYPLSGQRLSQCCSQLECWYSREESLKSPRGDSSLSGIALIRRGRWEEGIVEVVVTASNPICVSVSNGNCNYKLSHWFLS